MLTGSRAQLLNGALVAGLQVLHLFVVNLVETMRTALRWFSTDWPSTNSSLN